MDDKKYPYSERGKRLYEFFCSKGYKTKKEFAEKMNIQPQWVNKYFSGEFNPVDLMIPLALEDCDIQWLITGKKQDPDSPIQINFSSNHNTNIAAIRKVLEAFRNINPANMEEAEITLRKLLQHNVNCRTSP